MQQQLNPKLNHFNLTEDAGKNLKHGIDSTIKHSECFTEHTIKNEIRWLLFKYKHGNNIHEHRKKENK